MKHVKDQVVLQQCDVMHVSQSFSQLSSCPNFHRDAIPRALEHVDCFIFHVCSNFSELGNLDCEIKRKRRVNMQT